MGTEGVEVRAAWYALRPGGWRDYVTLLHPPYTAWHLSYVVVGASLAPRLHVDRLLWTSAAFALALGVGAHAYDELQGSPLGTAIPRRTLHAVAAASLAAAAAIGVGAAAAWGWWLLAFVAAGVFLVPAYNLELFGGRFHSDAWFALAWGAFPALTAYFAQAQSVRPVALGPVVYATGLSLVQRRLSTPVRHARRSVGSTAGTEPLERALRALTVASVAVACVLLTARLT